LFLIAIIWNNNESTRGRGGEQYTMKYLIKLKSILKNKHTGGRKKKERERERGGGVEKIEITLFFRFVFSFILY
jgi:hypothetical protein